MPKVKLNNHSINHDFTRLLKANAILYGKDQAYMAKVWGMHRATANERINNPERITVQELRQLIKELHITSEQIITFLDMKG